MTAGTGTGSGSSAAPAPEVDQRRYAREITSLLALPAFWGGREPAFVIRTLFEAFETLWHLEAAYASIANLPAEPVVLLRVDQATADPGEPLWAPLARIAREPLCRESLSTLEVANRGPLRIVRLPIGYVGDVGCVVLASRDPAFPNATDLALLHAAIGLTASALENARLLRQRDEAQRAKDDFLAMLGHELRNPLAPIVTALQLMALRAGGQKSREQEIIERQVKHLRALVDDLLDVSRITRGKIELQKEQVDLADLVTRAVEIVAPLAASQQQSLDVEVPPGLRLDADPTRLTQVLSNLLTNATKYTPPGGRIRICAGGTDGAITIRVIDSGVGITPELMPRLFDLFVQGRRTAARSEGGLGIGLTVVKRLVELHGGTVSARSDGPGRGSEFSISLPAAAEGSRDPDRAPEAAAFAGKEAPRLAILVVDDNHDAAELATAVLTAYGHQVDVAHTAAEALARTARRRPDLVLLDIGLPDLDGYALAAKIAATHPDPPQLIAVTGYGQPEDHARSRQAGFQAHLVKPVEPDRLLQTIQQVLERAGLRG